MLNHQVWCMTWLVRYRFEGCTGVHAYMSKIIRMIIIAGILNFASSHTWIRGTWMPHIVLEW
jgi:hypothetical protein